MRNNRVNIYRPLLFGADMEWQRVLLIAVFFTIAIFIGLNFTNYKVRAVALFLILLEIGLFLWKFIPQPRSFNILLFCIFLMPLGILLPQKIQRIMDFVPVFNTIKNIPLFAIVIFILFILLVLETLLLRKRLFLPGVIWLGTIMFLLGGLIALMRSGIQDYARDQWGSICLLGTATLFLSSTIIKHIKQAEKLFSVLVVGIIVYAFSLFILMQLNIPFVASNFLKSHNRLGGLLVLDFSVPVFGEDRMSFGCNPPQLSELCAIGLVIAFTYVLRSQSKKGRRAAAFVFALLAFIMIITNGRGGLIAGAVGMGFVYFASMVWKRPRLSVRPLVISTLIIVILGILFFWNQYAAKNRELVTRVEEMSNIWQSDTFIARMYTWRTLWPKIKNELFGTGFFGPSNVETVNPHNLFLWILMGTGIIGLLGFLFMITGIVPAILRGLKHHEPRRRSLSLAAFGVLAVTFTAGMGGIFFHGPIYVVFFWVLMGTVIAINRR